MKFSAVVFFAVCGGMLVTGGTLIGSDVTLGIGFTFWGAAVLLLLHSVWRFTVDTWHDWRFKRYMEDLRKRKPNPAPRYSRNAGMR